MGLTVGLWLAMGLCEGCAGGEVEVSGRVARGAPAGGECGLGIGSGAGLGGGFGVPPVGGRLCMDANQVVLRPRGLHPFGSDFADQHFQLLRLLGIPDLTEHLFLGATADQPQQALLKAHHLGGLFEWVSHSSTFIDRSG